MPLSRRTSRVQCAAQRGVQGMECRWIAEADGGVARSAMLWARSPLYDAVLRYLDRRRGC